jgi:hypothetical protein
VALAERARVERAVSVEQVGDTEPGDGRHRLGAQAPIASCITVCGGFPVSPSDVAMLVGSPSDPYCRPTRP